jgi:hypothetical protein
MLTTEETAKPSILGREHAESVGAPDTGAVNVNDPSTSHRTRSSTAITVPDLQIDALLMDEEAEEAQADAARPPRATPSAYVYTPRDLLLLQQRLRHLAELAGSEADLLRVGW